MPKESLGRYEIQKELGRGAMGVVLDGWDPIMERRVAIKTFGLPTDLDDETRSDIERFKREAQAGGRLIHSNIAAVYDFGETKKLAFIVMEFVSGKTVRQLLTSGEAVPMLKIVDIMHDLLSGLYYSHERGVVHRDIKPSNLMLTPEGRIKIVDFGIARIAGSTLTRHGMQMGTPGYMSPEQITCKPVQLQTDLYSAGVLLFQLLTGVLPFGGSIDQILAQTLNAVPPRPSDRHPGCDRAFDAVVAKAMEKEPGRRFDSALTFAAEFLAAVGKATGQTTTSKKPSVAAWLGFVSRGEPRNEDASRTRTSKERELSLQRAELHAARETLDSKERELSLQRAEFHAARETLERMQQEIAGLTTKVYASRAKRQALSDELIKLEKEAKDARAAFGLEEKVLIYTRQEVASLTETLLKTRAELKMLGEERIKLQTEMGVARGERTKLETEGADARVMLTEEQKMLTRARKEVTHVTTSLRVVRAERQELSGERTKLDTEAADARVMLEEEKKILARARREITQITTSLRAMRAERQELNDKRQALRNERSKLESEAADARVILEEEQKMLTRVRREATHFKAILRPLRAERLALAHVDTASLTVVGNEASSERRVPGSGQATPERKALARTAITVPTLGEGEVTATVKQWLKKVGETVTENET